MVNHGGGIGIGSPRIAIALNATIAPQHTAKNAHATQAKNLNIISSSQSAATLAVPRALNLEQVGGDYRKFERLQNDNLPHEALSRHIHGMVAV
jgi:hypothetical protein